MFVLITAECEVIGCETKVEAFATKRGAWNAMVRDAKARAWDAGIHEDEFDEYIDSIGDDGGYIVDVVGWQIRELPGAFIPEHNAKCFKQSINEMHEIYCDEDREDWFDADDMAKDIAYELEEYLG